VAVRLCLQPVFTLVSCSAYSSDLKMEATCSFETSVGFQRTTRRDIPEDRNLHELFVCFSKTLVKTWGETRCIVSSPILHDSPFGWLASRSPWTSCACYMDFYSFHFQLHFCSLGWRSDRPRYIISMANSIVDLISLIV
jgi:hypothetical protein